MLSSHVLDDDLAGVLLIPGDFEGQLSELGGVEGVEEADEELLLLLPPRASDRLSGGCRGFMLIFGDGGLRRDGVR